ncbi:unnamed protein product [Periconia digitata]|uniref:Uncharacterized protein n=1 Tax=Periconia digitata TaxID=1303443 RepID=A0A9W4UK08_9PLEO|nr:unnamed protein product [Periconia digitata]
MKHYLRRIAANGRIVEFRDKHSHAVPTVRHRAWRSANLRCQATVKWRAHDGKGGATVRVSLLLPT